MSPADPVRPRRGYDATARRERARRERSRTRAGILTASRELFLAHGYAGTSMAGVAAKAGVSVQTVYVAVGTKQQLLRAVAAQAVLGHDEVSGGTGVVPEQEWADRLAAETDPYAQLQLLVTGLVDLAERAAPLWQVMEQAALEEEGIAADLRAHQAGRLRDQRALVGMLHGLRVPAGRAVDVVSGFLRPDMWRTFVVERGWTRAEVEELCVDVLAHLLLEDRPHEATGREDDASTDAGRGVTADED